MALAERDIHARFFLPNSPLKHSPSLVATKISISHGNAEYLWLRLDTQLFNDRSLVFPNIGALWSLYIQGELCDLRYINNISTKLLLSSGRKSKK